MIFQLLVPLTLVIGQCIIAMEVSQLGAASEHPLHGIDPSATVCELHSASESPIPNKPSTSPASFQTLDDSEKENLPRLDNQAEEHWISIPDDSSSTTAQLESSQKADLAMSEFNPGTAQHKSITDHESSCTELGISRLGNIARSGVKCWNETDFRVRAVFIAFPAALIVVLAMLKLKP
ncbi:hypothetical protein Pst134EA_032655 [Puccinia striiformis f. sp. tritici]|uniref:uncharacterized protein n=1 Tax=Puccinia striiformis f. sp. tritici TaxID=168172 RepID=UPI0020087DFA|nr:uncharacterized protein Pst134EA_032655 [Puccinia striiformis f. sp. tritici]KAH9443465.1 hypothetical protein Pst134EA_032655 [Puccinia striiformis f. sp. tritici]